MIIFTDSEIKSMQRNPDVLRSLAACHDFQQCEVESLGAKGSFFADRRKELLQEAQQIED